MSPFAQISFHASQFPEQVRRDLLESLRSRRVHHKFHYDSVKQTQKWLALHQAYSPSRTDWDCAAIYDRSFAAVANHISNPRVHLVGLGCGGGQKDSRLLKRLREAGKEVSYTPADVSAAMVLVAREAALQVIEESDCFPLVCDLTTAADWTEVFGGQIPAAPTGEPAARVFTFFGMLPNFESDAVLSRLAALAGPNTGCFSAPTWRPDRITSPGSNAFCRSTIIR